MFFRDIKINSYKFKNESTTLMDLAALILEDAGRTLVDDLKQGGGEIQVTVTKKETTEDREVDISTEGETEQEIAKNQATNTNTNQDDQIDTSEEEEDDDSEDEDSEAADSYDEPPEIEIPASKLVFAITNDEVVKTVFFDMNTLVKNVVKTLKSTNLSRCGFVLYELRSSVPDRQKTMYPISIQFTRMMKSINAFIQQECRTGFVGLTFVKKGSTKRDIAYEVFRYVSALLPKKVRNYFQEVIEGKEDREILLSDEFKDRVAKFIETGKLGDDGIEELLTYSDWVFNKLFNDRQFKLKLEELNLLDEEVLKRLLDGAPGEKVAVLRLIRNVIGRIKARSLARKRDRSACLCPPPKFVIWTRIRMTRWIR